MKPTRNSLMLIGGGMLISSGFFMILAATTLERVPKEMDAGLVLIMCIAGFLQAWGLVQDYRQKKLERASIKQSTMEPR